MKLIVLFFSQFLLISIKPLFGSTKPWPQFENLKCKSEFNKVLIENKWSEEKFTNQIPSSFNQSAFRNMSQKIGDWIEVQVKADLSPEIVHLKDQKFKRFSFNSQCEVLSKDESLPWHLERVYNKKNNDMNNWDDEDLKKVVSQTAKGLIYYWSPKFAYSVVDIPRVEKLAKRLGLSFIPVVDPRASEQEISGALEVLFNKEKKLSQSRALASKYIVNRNVSLDLYMRNGFNHFPVSFVFSEGRIHSRFITGVMTDAGEKALIQNYLSDLKVGKK